jgi:hypothetical protein
VTVVWGIGKRCSSGWHCATHKPTHHANKLIHPIFIVISFMIFNNFVTIASQHNLVIRTNFAAIQRNMALSPKK